MIEFNVPPYLGVEMDYIKQAVQNQKICGDGPITGKCHQWLEEHTNTRRALLTTSCTHALEMSAILSDLQPGDEVILPSYTFVSTAEAYALRGAKLIFVDINPKTMNIDENFIESAITERTKAIIVVHYAGVSCDMDRVMEIAKAHHLLVIEDAAQAVMSTYKGRALGSIGDYGCYSFHETKNYSMGEGGALLVNREDQIERAEIIREKGTNRARFLRGQVDKYTWVDIGSSYLPSELNAAYLLPQLEKAEAINDNRLASWNLYHNLFYPLCQQGKIECPVIPKECTHNAHMYYIKVKDIEERTKLSSYLREHGVVANFHYVPLHSSPAGRKYGVFHGEDRYTTSESERLLRMPMYYGLKEEEIYQVVELVEKFYSL